MQFDVITLFPEFFSSPLSCSLLGKAISKGIAQVNLINPRDFANNKHRQVDDEPYGGGAGMVLKAEPIITAVESVANLQPREVILLTPQGEKLTQSLLKQFATNYQQLVLICGHYEGIDERVQNIVTKEVSLGDFVLTCGEIPALTLINGVVRLIPGTVRNAQSLYADSFEDGLLDYPHYTRPRVFRDLEVPPVLLSGNHAHIAKWRYEQQLAITAQKRPDMIEKYNQEN